MVFLMGRSSNTERSERSTSKSHASRMRFHTASTQCGRRARSIADVPCSRKQTTEASVTLARSADQARSSRVSSTGPSMTERPRQDLPRGLLGCRRCWGHVRRISRLQGRAPKCNLARARSALGALMQQRIPEHGQTARPYCRTDARCRGRGRRGVHSHLGIAERPLEPGRAAPPAGPRS